MKRRSRSRTAKTATPGSYFHGSPRWGLAQIKSEAELGIGDNHGIYFTNYRYCAEIYAGRDGAVYEVVLETRRPCEQSSAPVDRVAFLWADDIARCHEAGIDCLTVDRSPEQNGMNVETVIFDASKATIIGVHKPTIPSTPELSEIFDNLATILRGTREIKRAANRVRKESIERQFILQRLLP